MTQDPDRNPLDAPAPGAGGRRERKREQLRRHLADTAWRLFETHGYDTVTMEAVAAAADVSKVTLYKHYPMKEALLRPTLHARFAHGLVQAHAQLGRLRSATRKLHLFVEGWAAATSAQRHYIAPYVRWRLHELATSPSADTIERSGIDRTLHALIVEGQQQGEIRRSLSADVLTDQLGGLMLTATLRWLNQPTLELAAEARSALALFLDGARAQR